MIKYPIQTFENSAELLMKALNDHDLSAISQALRPLNISEILEQLERLNTIERAVAYRTLPKDRAIEVFERLDAALQADLVSGLQEADVAEVFAQLSPDDRVALLDELPASVANRLISGLDEKERALTSTVLGYPQGAVGRYMSPEFVTTHPHLSMAETFARVRTHLDDAESVYTLPVTDSGRHLVGVISLRDVLRADDDALVAEIMKAPLSFPATEDVEEAARYCADAKVLVLPIVDAEERLVGILTVDDALQILEDAETEDAARSGGTEPLRRPYLATPVGTIVRARVVWLLVLALGATLTVQVIGAFEATLEQQVVLSLFIPLLIGTGGNTGNQAATTITRALALGDVRPRDFVKVFAREVRVGAFLGLLLGSLGFVIASLVFTVPIGWVIGLTLLGVCTMAASIGGLMPLLGKAVRADPAVFSNPFISTFVDATGLIIYFLIATSILGL
ncbi:MULTISPECIES: magnesium transporter [Arthrobacter]|uniref:Magnesium transporter MgtE n=1 Tax=Arthrobacter psychrochitiniphilus TaxID=291045 RepID=A0A2V3DVS7_9MICC|nr:magnesium transporter [Arthrobacter psychrochitiniphilus]NYG16756.1 magnesium transporter [Arthrobacter psychrochitiniphilus]PXA69147.1 magnesium transporter [Arthrobacter psychrochitiniphilus]